MHLLNRDMSRNFWILVGSGVVVITFVVTILVLRGRFTASTEDLVRAPSETTTARSSRSTSLSPDLTQEEQAIKDEVKRLEATLPKDIRETWSPELRKIMEERSARRAIGATLQATPTNTIPIPGATQ